MFRPVIAVPVPEGPRTELRLCILCSVLICLVYFLRPPLLKIGSASQNFAQGDATGSHRLEASLSNRIEMERAKWGKRPVRVAIDFESKLETRGW